MKSLYLMASICAEYQLIIYYSYLSDLLSYKIYLIPLDIIVDSFPLVQ